MSYSFQTNVTSLLAQENLRVNSQFQSQTITRLTSGYRINSSADDAAGLAVANGLRSDTAELTQGVQNANNGVSILQIIDGGLNNISNILDRLKTLATESASSTFSGDRATLNNEYQSLLTEITRQASNIGLVDRRHRRPLQFRPGRLHRRRRGRSGQWQRVHRFERQHQPRGFQQLWASAPRSVSGGGTNLISGTAVDLRTGTFLTGRHTGLYLQLRRHPGDCHGGRRRIRPERPGAGGPAQYPDQRIRSLSLDRCHHRPTELQRRLQRI